MKMAYAHSKKRLQALEGKARRIVVEDVKVLANDSWEKMLQNSMNTAFISLKVFTAGTVTNSYSESINSVLRRPGLNTKYSMLTVLRYLDNFASEHNCRAKKRFSSSDELLSVISEDVIHCVTTGALCRFKYKVQKSIDHCTLSKTNGTQGEITEKVTAQVRGRLIHSLSIAFSTVKRKRFQSI